MFQLVQLYYSSVNNVEDNEVESLLNSDKEDEEEGLDVTHDTDASLLRYASS